MLAEIKGKVNILNTNLSELREDELTGNFFGCMRYIPFNMGMKKILKNSIRPIELQSIIDDIDEDYWEDNIYLWQRVKNGTKDVELDVRMDFPSAVIGIEVKYNSGLSSDDAPNIENISAEDSNNQLSKEAMILKLLGQGKKKLLILLADETECVKTIKNKNIKIVEGVQLGYISWQEVLLQLKKLTGLNDFQQLVVSDLIDLLEKKGFARFSGFKLDLPYILPQEFWQFNTSYKGEIFSFDFAEIEKEKYYEFG